MPDGTLLSMPIPSDDAAAYSELHYKGVTFAELLRQLTPGRDRNHCHVDPDIREDVRVKAVRDWKPAFGQTNAAQGILANAGVQAGDIFLFFGWFRQTVLDEKGYRFAGHGGGDFYRHADLQVIYGYMEIGEILADPAEIAKYPWHPHAGKAFLENKLNRLYLPAERLTLRPDMKGYGTLSFRKDRVLTMEGQNRATWDALPFLMPEHVYGNKKNSARDRGLYYAGIWQELVIYESEGLTEWVLGLLTE